MAHLLSGERPTAAAFSRGFLASFLGWAGKVRARHIQRVALGTLLEFDAHRLNDLGISRQDIVDAMRNPAARDSRLMVKRAARAATMRSNAISTSLFEAGGTY
jgi:uncharacterized protein YjiS (DUF1127 family)